MPISALDQDYFLRLLKRLLPGHYLEPLKAPGPGYEVLQAYAQVGERLSLAVFRLDNALYILDAPGPLFSVGEVEFFRNTFVAGEVTIKAGTVVRAAASARDYTTTIDVVLGATDLTVVAPIRAVAPAYEWDVPGETMRPSGEILPGEITIVQRMVMEPAFGDPTVQVRQIDPTVGGALGLLDQHGADRGLPRLPGELNDPFRYRIRQLPDTVSPGALRRAVDAIWDPVLALLPPGTVVDMIEVWEHRYQECWDGPSTDLGPYVRNVFVYDDPRDPIPFRNRWLDEVEYRGAVIFVLPALPSVTDAGCAYDDTAMTPSEHQSSTGRRAQAAYDTTSGDPAALSGALLGCAYDGFDLQQQALYRATYDVLQQIKPAGVSVILERAGE